MIDRGSLLGVGANCCSTQFTTLAVDLVRAIFLSKTAVLQVIKAVFPLDAAAFIAYKTYVVKLESAMGKEPRDVLVFA